MSDDKALLDEYWQVFVSDVMRHAAPHPTGGSRFSSSAYDWLLEHLPPEIAPLLRATTFLHVIERDATHFKQLRDGMLDLERLLQNDSDLLAVRRCSEKLEQLETAVREAEALVTAAGYRWQAGKLVRPNGANPADFFRVLVELLLEDTPHVRNTSKLRKAIAAELEPLAFLPSDLLDTSSSGKLRHTVDNMIRRRKASLKESSA